MKKLHRQCSQYTGRVHACIWRRKFSRIPDHHRILGDVPIAQRRHAGDTGRRMRDGLKPVERAPHSKATSATHLSPQPWPNSLGQRQW
jgi:hypothetical protein